METTFKHKEQPILLFVFLFSHGTGWCDYVGAKFLSVLLHTKFTSVYACLDF